MNKNIYPFVCKVCAFQGYYPEAPWGEDGESPTYDFCDCCGAEFGFDDYNTRAIKACLKQWISDGGKFFRSKIQPDGWTLEDQLKKINPEYLKD